MVEATLLPAGERTGAPEGSWEKAVRKVPGTQPKIYYECLMEMASTTLVKEKAHSWLYNVENPVKVTRKNVVKVQRGT